MKELSRYIRDYIFYKKIAYSKRHDWNIISPYAIGDTYFICALSEQILKHHGGARVNVITKKSHADIVELFSKNVSPIFLPNHFNWDLLKQLTRFALGKPFVGNPYYLDPGLLSEKLGSEGCTILDLFRSNFSLPPSAPLLKPSAEEGSRCRAKALFQKMNLPIGKTAILAPGSNSFRMLPAELWIELSKELQANGWKVCTNTINDEAPMSGTLALSYPLAEAIAIAELAGLVISARSGLCDLISSAKCKLHILYLKEPFQAGTPYSAYSLKKMSLSQNAYEYEYNPDEGFQTLISEIINSVFSYNPTKQAMAGAS